MLLTSNQLKGFTIRATDGELGVVDQLYFDDETWAIRYLTVETGGWLGGRPVLISPISLIHTDADARRLDVALTKKQVADSPDVDTQKPVSRQHEADYLQYYGYPFYWEGPFLWGPSAIPLGSNDTDADKLKARAREESLDTHLRSTEEVSGYHIETIDGEIGHVDGFLIDAEAWTIRYLEVATRNWWPGKKVLFSPGWVERVSWLDSRVHVHLMRELIESAPAYDESQIINREYEAKLFFHYGQPPYWLPENELQAALLGAD